MLFHWLRGGAHTGIDIEQMIVTLREEVVRWSLADESGPDRAFDAAAGAEVYRISGNPTR
jgi:hypothetical protein